MSFWTYGIEQLMLLNPLTALGKGAYNVYTQIKNVPIATQTNVYQDLIGFKSLTSSVGGLSEGVADIGAGFKTAVTEYPKMFETGAKYGTLSIALIAGVVALYLLKK